MREIRKLRPSDRAWSNALLCEHFDSTRVVSLGRLHDAAALPSLVAVEDGIPVGSLHYSLDGGQCEVVTLVVERPRMGIGTALLGSLVELAKSSACSRLWLVTTNDNHAAQAFYRAVGWRCVAVHAGAIARSRMLKPEIPALGIDGIPLEDEIEFDLDIGRIIERTV